MQTLRVTHEHYIIFEITMLSTQFHINTIFMHNVDLEVDP